MSTVQGFAGVHGSAWETMTAEEALGFVVTAPVLPSIDKLTLLLQKCRKARSRLCAEHAYWLLCEQGLENHKILGNYLVPMFMSCRNVHQAQRVYNRFPHLNEHSWTSLIQGLVDSGDPQGALDVFERMEEDALLPSRYTFAALLKACVKLKCIERGQQLHAAIVSEEFEGDPFLVSALVDLYAKCASLAEAEDVFDCLPAKDVVCWTTLITGYAEQGLGEKAWKCLKQMQLSGVPPDVVLWNAVIMAYAEHEQTEKAFKTYEKMQEQGLLPSLITFLNVSKACGNKAAQKVGMRVHAQVHRLASTEVGLVTAFVDMYGKCGKMELAQELFDSMPVKSLVTWNALITGYVHQGENELVFALFDQMRDEGVHPDAITFLNVLSICCHGGFLGRAQRYFQSMQNEYGVIPNDRHYNCMIDLLGRVGRLNEAVAMMDQMPRGPNYVTWSSLLGACQKWGDVEFCKQAFENAVRLKLEDGKVFILMSNIYADIRRWGEAKKIEASEPVLPYLEGVRNG